MAFSGSILVNSQTALMYSMTLSIKMNSGGVAVQD